MTNWRKFYDCYLEELRADIAKYPEKYFYDSVEAANVADRMTTALMNGTAMLSNAVKRTAKSLGIQPRAKAIQEFLKGE